ncbi:MAG TPA: putative porin [Chthoniobacterales bacterium]|nr:putative porin [Chthoniobacterales bacterium]
MIKRVLPILALTVLLASTSTTTHAQSSAADQALLDALVKKGVLTEKEAEAISAEAANAVSTAPSNKITVGDWIKQLSLSGDFRLRNQWDQRTPLVLTNPALGPQDINIQRNRWRFRLRLNADVILQDNFFAGVQLATSDNRAADTANATYTGGYDDYRIYISRAFMGWKPTPAFTFIVGKQANPFYTTDLIYDPEISPAGLVERVDFDKIFDLSWGEPVAAEGKEGKAPPPPPPAPGVSLQLALIAGQFVTFNNNADSGLTGLKWDAYQFQQQLLAKLKIGDKLTITLGPGLLAYNNAMIGSTATTTAPFVSNGVVYPAGTYIPPVNQNIDTAGLAPLNNAQPYPITQRDMLIILAPGDITYNKLFGRPLTLYWDFAYNTEGNARFQRDIGPLFSQYFFVGKSSTPSFRDLATPGFSDDAAWVVGLKYGQNKKAGDFSISADYRQVGVASIDPNINSSNFALSNLNTAGWEFNGAYNFTDFLTAVVTFYYSDALNGNIYGGYATGNVPNGPNTPLPNSGTAQYGSTQQYPIARDRHDKVLQVNLLMKF